MQKKRRAIYQYAPVISLFLFIFFFATLVSAATVTIRYPSTGQLLNAVTGYKGDNINITVNATVLLAGGELNVTNVSFWYRTTPTSSWNLIGWNASHNLTENQGNLSYFMQWNISTLADGTTYDLNATAYNSTAVIGASVVTGLVLDHTRPTATLTALDSITKKSKSTFSYGDAVILRCTRSDATTQYNETNISAQVPGETSYNPIHVTTESGSSSKDLDVKFVDTRALGNYFFFCSVTDQLGLVNATANATFEILPKAPAGGSPFQDPNFKPPVATIIVGAGTTSNLGTLSEIGTSRLIAKTGTIRVDFNNKLYTITLKDYTGDAAPHTAMFTVDDSFDVSLNSGETKPVDLNADGVDDISIEFHKIFSKKADTTFKLLSLQQAPKVEPIQPPEPTPSPQPTTQESKGSSLLFVMFSIIIAIIIIFVILHYLAGRQRRGGISSSSGKSPIAFTRKDLGAYRQQGTASLHGSR